MQAWAERNLRLRQGIADEGSDHRLELLSQTEHDGVPVGRLQENQERKKNKVPIENPRKSWQNSGFGSGGSGGPFECKSLKKWPESSVELRVLLHLGLVTFRFHFGKIRTVIIFMIFGFLAVPMTPKTIF